MNARWSIATPPGRAGAIATIILTADDPDSIDRALAQIGFNNLPFGALRVGTLASIDLAVAARWSATRVDLMPHGGVAVLRALTSELTQLLGDPSTTNPIETYPEAASEIEARALHAIALAPSPRAIDVLLAQSARWGPDSTVDRSAGDRTPFADQLACLLHPPLVVAVGPPNVGKSSLLNALAGRHTALEADAPGTTRDHVGALLDVDGLTIRYVDTPGHADGDLPESDRDAHLNAKAVTERADLILSCSENVALPVARPVRQPDPIRTIRVQTRIDLGGSPQDSDIATSARTGEGIGDLARLIRRTLVSDEALADTRPWAFWKRDPRPMARP